MLGWYFFNSSNNMDFCHEIFVALKYDSCDCFYTHPEPLTSLWLSLNYGGANVIACLVEFPPDEKLDELTKDKYNIINIGNVTNALHEFALACAEKVLLREKFINKKLEEKYYLEALQVKRNWIKHSASSKELNDILEIISNIEDDGIPCYDCTYSMNLVMQYVLAENPMTAVRNVSEHAANYEALIEHNCNNTPMDITLKKVKNEQNKLFSEMLIESFKRDN